MASLRLGSSASSSAASLPWKTTLASVPVMVWARDSLVGLCRVQGTSMEPNLHHGDIVLVRKCDFGTLVDVVLSLIVGDRKENDPMSKNSTTERARLVRYESVQGITTHAPVSRLYETPPLALTGQVVVFQDPTTFPPQLTVKRVIGVGGQWVRLSSSTQTQPSQRQSQFYAQRQRIPRQTTSVPPYSLYVEGTVLVRVWLWFRKLGFVGVRCDDAFLLSTYGIEKVHLGGHPLHGSQGYIVFGRSGITCRLVPCVVSAHTKSDALSHSFTFLSHTLGLFAQVTILPTLLIVDKSVPSPKACW